MMFNGCSSLINIPNISKWNITPNYKKEKMFDGCPNLVDIPDLSQPKKN